MELAIPRHQLTVITGVSGSGKSSLAFDTLHAEGSRQYLESLSAKARGLLESVSRPDVDFIRGLSPVVAIAQRTGGNTNPRSTVATLTEIADHARPLWILAGERTCLKDGHPVRRRSLDDNLKSLEAIAAGTALAGVDGLACISCHGISGYPSLGVPAVDLSHTYGRLRHAWFDRYMRNPSAVYAGTRMPTFWQQGQHVHPDFLGGDPTKQIDALWTYLSLGSSMPLPKGMIAGGEYALMPQSRPIVLGTFMDGLSARCFAVGFPEQVHYVYDGDHRRTAKAWRGQFMDAAGTWFGRAGLLCKPAGIDVIDFPAGDPVAVLTNSQNPWPTRAGRDAGWRFLGSDRDSAGVPTFRTSDGALSIEERLAPAPAVGGAHLVRNFIIRAKTEPIGAMLRAWTSPSISSSDLLNGVTGWKAENGPTIFVTGGLAFVRTSAATNEQELLVPIGFQTGSDPERPYEAHIRLEYVW